MFKVYFNKFCEEHGYIGNLGYDENNKEYHIIISKGNDNAGVFMSEEELMIMNNQLIHDLLEMLHKRIHRKI